MGLNSRDSHNFRINESGSIVSRGSHMWILPRILRIIPGIPGACGALAEISSFIRECTSRGFYFTERTQEGARHARCIVILTGGGKDS